jgi:hypothetical protein
MIENAEKGNGVLGSEFVAGKRIIRVGLRALDQMTRRAGYLRLKRLVGPELATRVALLEFANWQEMDVGLENTSELYRSNVADIRYFYGE